MWCLAALGWLATSNNNSPAGRLAGRSIIIISEPQGFNLYPRRYFRHTVARVCVARCALVLGWCVCVSWCGIGQLWTYRTTQLLPDPNEWECVISEMKELTVCMCFAGGDFCPPSVIFRKALFSCVSLLCALFTSAFQALHRSIHVRTAHVVCVSRQYPKVFSVNNLLAGIEGFRLSVLGRFQRFWRDS